MAFGTLEVPVLQPTRPVQRIARLEVLARIQVKPSCAALLLRTGLGRENAAAAVESAVDRALEGGIRPRDLGGDATTAQTTDAVLEELK